MQVSFGQERHRQIQTTYLPKVHNGANVARSSIRDVWAFFWNRASPNPLGCQVVGGLKVGWGEQAGRYSFGSSCTTLEQAGLKRILSWDRHQVSVVSRQRAFTVASRGDKLGVPGIPLLSISSASVGLAFSRPNKATPASPHLLAKKRMDGR